MVVIHSPDAKRAAGFRENERFAISAEPNPFGARAVDLRDEAESERREQRLSQAASGRKDQRKGYQGKEMLIRR
jgi:hypothetical protein